MKVKLDATRAIAAYSTAFQRLKLLPGFDHRQVLRAEAGVMLKAWAGKTKVAQPDAAELFARYRAAKRAFGINKAGSNSFGITVNTGRRDGTPGMIWFRTRRKKWQSPAVIYSGGHISQSHLHFKDDDWARIEAGMVTYSNELKRILPAAQRAIGISRQSVIQIADDLGLDLAQVKGGGTLTATGIAKARAAIASNGSSYKNGSGIQGGDDEKCFLLLLTRYPMGQKIGMDSTLALIVAGRAKYIDTAYKKGAFNSMANVAKSFPEFMRVNGLAVADLPSVAA